MSRWVRVACAADIPTGSGAEFVVEDRILAVFRVGERYFALDGVCPHQGGPLGKGKLAGCVVTCPWHGWQFDVTTGQHQSIQPLIHRRYELRCEGEDLLAEFDDG